MRTCAVCHRHLATHRKPKAQVCSRPCSTVLGQVRRNQNSRRRQEAMREVGSPRSVA
jgi:hypothetical protein